MFLLNSRNPLTIAASFSSIRMDFTYQRHTFSRSYGAILPSSFTQVLSRALVFSTRPPVSVYGTVQYHLSLSDFSWKRGIGYFSAYSAPRHHASEFFYIRIRISLDPPPTRLNRDFQHPAYLAFSVITSQWYQVQEY